MNAVEIKPLEWRGDAESGALFLLDQRLLPGREQWIACRTVSDVAEAIRNMTVRGAPAIGVAAAYGFVLAAQQSRVSLDQARELLVSTRPTAANLAWALSRCWDRASPDFSPRALLCEAVAIHREDIENNRRIGANGADHLENGTSVLTHCNAGGLATGGVGTALSVVATAVSRGKRIHVFVDETRPRLQGARLTAWELSRLGIPYTLICDNMAAALMAKGRIHACVTGADRIAANGDTANKIGTYGVAVLARHHQIPFHVAAPSSTFDLGIATGKAIPIEERAPQEVSAWGGEQICPDNAPIYNPAFDVTPAELITSIVTESGIIQPVGRQTVARVIKQGP
jgi:methylthioribose-1-phosphate isomerase